MNTGIQSPHIPNAFDPLDLADLSVNAGTIDPELLQAVYAVSGEMIGLDSIISSLGSQTLGAWRTWTDAGATLNAANAPDISMNRWYTSIAVRLSGGVTANIDYQVSYEVPPGGAYRVLVGTCANAGDSGVYGVFVPAGQTLQIKNNTNGNAGDTMNVEITGVQAKPGAPLPTFPPLSVHNA